MSRVDELFALSRLDLGEVIRSRWLMVSSGIYLLLGLFFVFVALRESSVMGFTGLERVLISFSHALLFVLPILALTSTAQALAGARESGALEVIFAHPFSRFAYYGSLSVVRLSAALVPLLVIVPGVGLYARFVLGVEVPWPFVGRAMAIAFGLLWAFVGAGLWISSGEGGASRALTQLLVLWAASVALVDFALIGVMLQWRLNPEAVFVLAAANPVQAARMALLVSAEPDLSTLGPVGFHLAHRVGFYWLQVLGIGWPIVVGSSFWLAGWIRFRRSDLV